MDILPDDKDIPGLVARYTSTWPDTTWHAARHMTPARVWNWFGDAGCYIGPGGPLCDGYEAAAMTDPARTPFERLFYHAPTPTDPHAFIAVRPLPAKQCRGKLHDSMGVLGDIRPNLRDVEDGLIVFPLTPMLVCKPATESDEEERDWPPEAAFEVSEKELRALYGTTLVQWV